MINLKNILNELAQDVTSYVFDFDLFLKLAYNSIKDEVLNKPRTILRNNFIYASKEDIAKSIGKVLSSIPFLKKSFLLASSKEQDGISDYLVKKVDILLKKTKLNEYRDIVDRESIESEIRNSQQIILSWKNGYISRNRDAKSFLEKGIWNFITGKFDFKDKSVTFILLDDWSDFKYVLNVQQFLKDLIRLKWIDSNWRLILLTKKITKINLGGTTVGDLLKYDASFTKNIPICFHGTSDYYLDEILKFGITPRKYSHSEPNWDIGYTEESFDNIFLSIDYERAISYAVYTVKSLKKKGIKSNPIIVRIENLPIDNVTADDDISTNMGKLQLIDFLRTGKQQNVTYISGIRNSAQFAYNGRIPKSFIKKIYKE